ncbi:MAG: hypothetical protein P4L87_25315 [Formivibrio sp.]|nr:hypothetical protein [Formivibrio sp.]
MRCHLLIPHAVWPNQTESAEVTVGLTLPAFSLLAGRGRCELFTPIPARDWQGQAFGLKDFPAGPLTLLAADACPSPGFWLRADPVHLAINQRGAEVADPKALEVTADEAKQLIDALNVQFADDGLFFLAASPDSWLLRLPAAPDASFTPLESVLGRNMGEFLPQGRDAGRWHQLINEIQMMLYAHPVNDSRAGQGRPLINSLWLWGGGVYPLPEVQPQSTSLIHSDDPLLGALAGIAGVNCVPSPGSFSGVHGTDSLVILDNLSMPALWRDALAWREAWLGLERDWLAPALVQLQNGGVSELIITLPEAGIKISVRKRDLWRFWRRRSLPWS